MNYNLFAKKDIPYRSEAITDFFQGTVLDELQTFFCELDMANQMQFGKQKLIMEEQIRHNAKLENLRQASADKLSFLRSQRAGDQAEREALQLQLDDKLRQIRELEEEKKGLQAVSELEN